MAAIRTYPRKLMTRRQLRRYCHERYKWFFEMEADLDKGGHHGRSHKAEAEKNYWIHLLCMCSTRRGYLLLLFSLYVMGLPPLSRD